MVPPEIGPELGAKLVTDGRGCTIRAGPESLQSKPLLLTLTNIDPDMKRVGNEHTTSPLSIHFAGTLVSPPFSEHAKPCEFAKRLPVTVTSVTSAADTRDGLISRASASSSYRN